MKKTPLFAVIPITSFFFLWRFAFTLSLTIIPPLKKACVPTDIEAKYRRTIESIYKGIKRDLVMISKSMMEGLTRYTF